MPRSGGLTVDHDVAVVLGSGDRGSRSSVHDEEVPALGRCGREEKAMMCPLALLYGTSGM